MTGLLTVVLICLAVRAVFRNDAARRAQPYDPSRVRDLLTDADREMDHYDRMQAIINAPPKPAVIPYTDEYIDRLLGRTRQTSTPKR